MKPEFRITYSLKLGKGESLLFTADLTKKRWALRRGDRSSLPPWTRLSFRQCANCPLRDREFCPPAAALAEFVEAIKDRVSGTPTTVVVAQDDWKVKRRGGLSSMIAPLVQILMTTSGCPIFDPFRRYAVLTAGFIAPPQEEHILLGAHLLEEHLRGGGKRATEEAFRTLQADVDEFQRAFKSFKSRFDGVGTGDAHHNALLKMHCAVETAWMLLTLKGLQTMEGNRLPRRRKRTRRVGKGSEKTNSRV